MRGMSVYYGSLCSICCACMWAACVLNVCVFECVCGVCEDVYLKTPAIKVVPMCVGFTEGGKYLGSKNISTFCVRTGPP